MKEHLRDLTIFTLTAIVVYIFLTSRLIRRINERFSNDGNGKRVVKNISRLNGHKRMESQKKRIFMPRMWLYYHKRFRRNN